MIFAFCKKHERYKKVKPTGFVAIKAAMPAGFFYVFRFLRVSYFGDVFLLRGGGF